jgi:hypothetical protein
LKKITAILLFVLLMFNWFGYRLLVGFMEGKADMQLVANLDSNNYDESQLVSVKVPAAHLSGYIHSTAFERMNGQVEIKGVTYDFVKIKLYNDSLELLCIPNHAATKLKAANNYFFKLVNDIQHSGNKKQGQAASKYGVGDFVATTIQLFNCNIFFPPAQIANAGSADDLARCFSIPIENPPEKNS